MDGPAHAAPDVDDHDARETHDDVRADPAPGAQDEGPSAALVEVLPGVAVVFGDLPESLLLDLVDFGVVPASDRRQLAATLGSIVGSTAGVAGSIASAVSSAQGLYRVGSTTQALLSNGAVLAVKDGANLGSVWMNGKLVAQARFIPVAAVSVASAAAAIGPAVAMVALQMQLNQITGLVRTNVALTSQTLGTVLREQWAELSGHVAAIDRALAQAREIESVPASLWDTVSGNEAALRKQVDLYRRHVGSHLGKIDQPHARARREYLEANAETIAFDSHALMSSLKAWTGYKALHAGKARTAGPDDADEARLVDLIVRDTRQELEPALAEATRLVDAVTRELRLIAELTGPSKIPLSRKGKDHRAARLVSTEMLRTIEPLADALRPPPPVVSPPAILCSLKDLDLDPYLRALRWVVDQDETLRSIAFCHQRDEADLVASVGQNVVSRIDPEQWATLVVVTDRRILTSRAGEFRREGRIGRQIPVDDVRYVRVRTGRGEGKRAELDLVTRVVDLRWSFHPETDDAQVEALAAVLAASMRLPDDERDALIRNADARSRGTAATDDGDAASPGPRAIDD